MKRQSHGSKMMETDCVQLTLSLLAPARVKSVNETCEIGLLKRLEEEVEIKNFRGVSVVEHKRRKTESKKVEIIVEGLQIFGNAEEAFLERYVEAK